MDFIFFNQWLFSKSLPVTFQGIELCATYWKEVFIAFRYHCHFANICFDNVSLILKYVSLHQQLILTCAVRDGQD